MYKNQLGEQIYHRMLPQVLYVLLAGSLVALLANKLAVEGEVKDQNGTQMFLSPPQGLQVS